MLKPIIEEKLGKVKKTIGLKESLKKLREGLVEKAYIAKDADKRVTEKFIKMCDENSIPVEYISSRLLLGRAAGIKVGAAIVCELKDI
jgi:large subunit ribosomal protein L7A